MARLNKHLLSELSFADVVTLSAVALIVFAFYSLWNHLIDLSLSLAFFSMFCDYLDGIFARKFGSSSYGKIYDSLYDVLGWVLFPALFITVIQHFSWYAILISTLYCVFAVMRLGRFTLQGYVESDKKYYVGLPVLFSKYALLTSFFFRGYLSILILIVMIPLMVSSRLVRKPHPLLTQVELLIAIFFLVLYFYHGV